MTGQVRLALVTGGCRRLGAAIAARLARSGYALALHASHEAEPEPVLRHALAETRWHAFSADFAERPAAEQLWDAVLARFGRAPDLLVNNASVFGPDTAFDVTGDALAEAFAVNCAAPVLLTRLFAAAGGSGRAVVNILDQRIAHPHADQLAYTLGKLGLAGWTEIAGRAFAPGVRVNAVAPGLTLPSTDYRPGQMEALAALMPLGRLPTPEAIAAAVLFLADAPFTGQTLFVDGGAHLCAFERDFVHLT